MGSDTNPVVNSPDQRDLSDMLGIIVPPFILVTGTVNNVIVLILMKETGKGFCGPSMTVFFLALATVDQLVLSMGLGRRWVRSLTGFDIRNVHTFVCKVHKFLLYTGTRNTAWITVAITTQRVFAVMWPIGHKVYATKKTALVVISVIAILCALVDTGVLLEFAVVNKGGNMKCTALKRKSYSFFHKKIYSLFNVLTVYILPSFILSLNSSILVYKLNKDRFISDTQKLRSKKATSISLISIAIAWLFMLLHLSIPSTVFTIMLDKPPLPKLLQTILDLMLYCCYAVNFYLFIMTSSALRGKTKTLLCGTKYIRYSSTGNVSPTRRFFSKNCPNRRLDLVSETSSSDVSSLTSTDISKVKTTVRTGSDGGHASGLVESAVKKLPALNTTELSHLSLAESQESTKPPHTPDLDLPYQSQESNKPPQSPQRRVSFPGQEMLQNLSTPHEWHENLTCPQNSPSSHRDSFEDNEGNPGESLQVQGSFLTFPLFPLSNTEDSSASELEQQTSIFNLLCERRTSYY